MQRAAAIDPPAIGSLALSAAAVATSVASSASSAAVRPTPTYERAAVRR